MPATLNRLPRLWPSGAALVLGVAAVVAWAPAPPAPNGAQMDCSFNITARNNGSTDVWVQFYTSAVRRRSAGITWTRWDQLDIQNHRVAPGVTIRRSYTDNGRCDVQRQWRFDLKRGADTYRYTTSTEATTGLNLGDVSRFF